VKIAMYVPSWPPGSSPNGIVTYAAQIVPALRRLGHEVFILTPGCEGGADPYLIDIRQYERAPSVWQKLLVKLFPDAAFDAATATLVSSVKDLIARYEVEVIEIEESFGWSGSLSKLKTIPVVVRLHGPWFLNRRSNTKKTRLDLRREKWEGRGIKSAQAVTSPSHKILDLVTSYYGLNLKTARIFANPMQAVSEAERWNLATCDKNRLLFVGRFDTIKGGDLVLRAFGELAAKNRDVKMTFVGPDIGVLADDGTLISFGNYAERVLSSDVLSRLTFRGKLPQSEIAALRTTHFATISASQMEVLPYAVLEATAYGCPIVATDVGGVSELIRSGDNGVLVASGDQAAMVSALQNLIDHPVLAEQYGSQAWEDCRTRFWVDQIAKAAEAVFMEAIARGV
jgi:glycosyltransferase involved in cell wall biosynthesis